MTIFYCRQSSYILGGHYHKMYRYMTYKFNDEPRVSCVNNDKFYLVAFQYRTTDWKLSSV